MSHVPYGYKIVNGVAVVNSMEADNIKQLYKNYLSGMALEPAAKSAGINVRHSGAKHIMQNKHYLGDDFYPALINWETFNKAAEEIARRSSKLGRDNRKSTKKITVVKIQTKFRMKEVTKYLETPTNKAEYLYSLIESEE